MKYYYCDETKKLIPLDTIINSSFLPISVIKISEKISEYIDIVESTSQFVNSTPILYTDENREIIIVCFFKLDKYRRGSVYVGIQISFNHKAGYNVKPYSDPYEKCNISIEKGKHYILKTTPIDKTDCLNKTNLFRKKKINENISEIWANTNKILNSPKISINNKC